MLWLFDRNRAQTGVLVEYDSILTTRRFSEDSSWTGRFPSTSLDLLDAAYFCQVQGETELYLVEKVELVTEEGELSVLASGRSATALLHLRTIEGTMRWSSATPGTIISDMIASLTGARALPGLSFGTGDASGTAIDLERSWGDMGEIARSVLSQGTLGCRASLDGTGVIYDVYGPQTVAALIGDVYGNATGARLVHDDTEWRNYAYVLGETERPEKSAVTALATYGGSLTGTASDVSAVDAAVANVVESAANGLTLQFAFGAIPAGSKDLELVIVGYYNGAPNASHFMLTQIAEDGSTFSTLQALTMQGAGSSKQEYRIPIPLSAWPAAGRIRLTHNVTTYNAVHVLYVNYAVIEYKAPREQVEVDMTDGAERRELYVDARDLQSQDADDVNMLIADYQALLEVRGKEKLADTRRIEYADASVDTPLNPGDVSWYDGRIWSAELMASESSTTYEKGMARHGVTLGEPPATLRKTIRRATG